MKNIFCSIAEAIKEIKKSKMLIVVDDPSRENEGDFFCPTETVTAKKLTYMIRFGGGLICTAITKKQAARLSLPLMIEPQKNTENTKVSFTISVNAKKGITTGISAFDRSHTIRILGDPKSKEEDLVRPGHVFPLIAEDGGLLKRSGHTEAAVTLSKLAGFHPSGVLCEILRNDGKMAGMKDLRKIAKKFYIKIISIADLTHYLKKNPITNSNHTRNSVRVASSFLPTQYGTFEIIIYRSLLDCREHVVLRLGENQKEPTLVRIHSQCLTGDTLLSMKCDCREQLHQSMKIISQNKKGLIIYLNQEGRGIGLANKIKAYALQENGMDTVEANLALHLPIDARDYQIAADILQDLGISKISLLTNNPDKIHHLISYGIIVANKIPLEVFPNEINRGYLKIKKEKLGHLLTRI